MDDYKAGENNIMEYTLPFFSILIPAYNIADYIEECINSIRKQTYLDWEAIIVDDGSTDGTGEICSRFAKEDSRIRVLRQENQGVAMARNVLLKEARGVFFIFMDGDDFWCSDQMLYEIQEAIEKQKADIVAWWLKIYDNETGEYAESTNSIRECQGTRTGKEFLMSVLSQGRNCWWSWLYAFHRSFWESGEISFRPGRKVCEDEEVLFRIFMQAQRVWVLGKYYYAYRVNRRDSAMGCPDFQSISDRLEVAERNIWYLQEDDTICEDLKQALIKNFSCTWMNLGINLYKLGGVQQECLTLLKDRKWMLGNLWGYGTIKLRIKTMLVRICGVRAGLWVIWQWEQKRKR